jgi:hypothetical protein
MRAGETIAKQHLCGPATIRDGNRNLVASLRQVSSAACAARSAVSGVRKRTE